MTADRVQDPAVIGGHDDFGRTRFASAIGDVHYHRLAGDLGERLAGQPRRSETGRDDDYKLHGARGQG